MTGKATGTTEPSKNTMPEATVMAVSARIGWRAGLQGAADCKTAASHADTSECMRGILYRFENRGSVGRTADMQGNAPPEALWFMG